MNRYTYSLGAKAHMLTTAPARIPRLPLKPPIHDTIIQSISHTASQIVSLLQKQAGRQTTPGSKTKLLRDTSARSLSSNFTSQCYSRKDRYISSHSNKNKYIFYRGAFLTFLHSYASMLVTTHHIKWHTVRPRAEFSSRPLPLTFVHCPRLDLCSPNQTRRALFSDSATQSHCPPYHTCFIVKSITALEGKIHNYHYSLHSPSPSISQHITTNTSKLHPKPQALPKLHTNLTKTPANPSKNVMVLLPMPHPELRRYMPVLPPRVLRELC